MRPRRITPRTSQGFGPVEFSPRLLISATNPVRIDEFPGNLKESRLGTGFVEFDFNGLDLDPTESRHLMIEGGSVES